jgi:hypothetical protein
MSFSYQSCPGYPGSSGPPAAGLARPWAGSSGDCPGGGACDVVTPAGDLGFQVSWRNHSGRYLLLPRLGGTPHHLELDAVGILGIQRPGNPCGRWRRPARRARPASPGSQRARRTWSPPRPCGRGRGKGTTERRPGVANRPRWWSLAGSRRRRNAARPEISVFPDWSRAGPGRPVNQSEHDFDRPGTPLRRSCCEIIPGGESVGQIGAGGGLPAKQYGRVMSLVSLKSG